MLSWLLHSISAYNLRKQQQEVWDEQQRKIRENLYNDANEGDYYWLDDISKPDYNYYRDGSLRYDCITRKFYPKGTYYADCHGYGPGARRMPSNIKRAPKQ